MRNCYGGGARGPTVAPKLFMKCLFIVSAHIIIVSASEYCLLYGMAYGEFFIGLLQAAQIFIGLLQAAEIFFF